MANNMEDPLHAELASLKAQLAEAEKEVERLRGENNLLKRLLAAHTDGALNAFE